MRRCRAARPEAEWPAFAGFRFPPEVITVAEAGDPTAARDRYAALLPIWYRVSGPEHPATLTARAHLARWTGEVGDAAAARDRYAALLPIRERVSGPEHPYTLAVRGSLAYWTGEAGDPTGGPGPV
jgi:hypothetical protein